MNIFRRPHFALLVVFGVSLPLLAQAAPITINNYSFETPVISAPSTSQDVTESTPGFGWTKGGNVALQVQTSSFLIGRHVPVAFFDGTQALRVYGGVGANIPSSATQATAASLAGNMTYTLQVNIAPITNGAGANIYSGFNITLSAGTDFSYNIFTTYSSAGSTFSISNSPVLSSNILSANYSFTNGYSLANDTYTTLTLTVTTKSAVTNPGALTISLGAGDRGNDTSTLFDNVRLDAVAVPEPSVAALMAFGGAAGFFWFRRRTC